MAAAICPVRTGSALKARRKITGLSGLVSTSATGARFMVMPTARSSSAIASPMLWA